MGALLVHLISSVYYVTPLFSYILITFVTQIARPDSLEIALLVFAKLAPLTVTLALNKAYAYHVA